LEANHFEKHLKKKESESERKQARTIRMKLPRRSSQKGEMTIVRKTAPCV
jgi:hypothetical protein